MLMEDGGGGSGGGVGGMGRWGVVLYLVCIPLSSPDRLHPAALHTVNRERDECLKRTC